LNAIKNDTVWNRIKQSFFAGAIVLIAVQKFFTKLKQRLVPNLLFQYREPQASRHSRL
jgi:hypothetical protein